jgi:single stranded DNA-binding protein
MQKIIVSGRLTKDAVSHQGSNGGDGFFTFGLAANTRVKGNEVATFYDVVCNTSRRTQNMIQHLTKGTAVIVTGDFSAGLYDRNDGSKGIRLSINADSIEFNSTGGKRDENADGQANTGAPEQEAPKPAKKGAAKKVETPDEDIVMTSGDSVDDNDDLPF